jgi:indole-3-acetate monooxygenase
MTALAVDPMTPDAAFVEEARKLAPLVEAEADNSEQLGTMPPAVVDALRDAGLFFLMVPKELGGAEVNAVTALAVFEELTAADASIGWSMMANASTGSFSAFLGDAAASAMFGDGPAIMAGQFAPRGQSVPEEGGFRVSGRYSFGSGSGHADWVGGGTLEMDGGAPKMAGGMPAIRAFFVPREKVEFLGGWDVMGLVGTGSFDYAVSNELVDPDFTFSIINPQQRRGGSLYGLGVLGMTSIGHAGFSLGATRRALDEVIALAPRKQRMSHSTPVAGIERFQYELGRHSAMYRAARAFTYEAFGTVQAAIEAGDTLSLSQLATLRQATTHITHVSAAVVDFAYHWAGADGIRPGVMQRLWRDVHASTQHIFVDDSTFTEAGKRLLTDAGAL